MCLTPIKAPQAISVDPAREAQAAADSATRERRSAQGFSSTILGGLMPQMPQTGSLARQLMLGA